MEILILHLKFIEQFCFESFINNYDIIDICKNLNTHVYICWCAACEQDIYKINKIKNDHTQGIKNERNDCTQNKR